jgi:AhpD family alkylhydroperoxidase
MSSTKTPMDLVREFAPEFAKNQMEEKALLFDHPSYQAVPAKYKTLIGVAVAAALGSEMCTEMWARQAKEKGATVREITEAIMVARFMKQATVNDTAAKTLTWLAETGADAGV